MVQEILTYIVIFASIIYTIYSLIRFVKPHKDKQKGGCRNCGSCNISCTARKFNE